MRVSQISGSGLVQNTSSSTLWSKGGNFGPHHCFSFTGPPTYDRYRQHYSCSLYQQKGWDPFPYPVMSSSGSVPMATNSRHSQTHSRLSKRDRSSVPPISAEPAHNRVKASPRNSDPDLPDMRNSNTGNACLPQSTTRIFPSLCLQSRSLEHWR